MKIDPISIHERAFIIQQLKVAGKWSGVRKGVPVQLARILTQSGNRILFAVKINHAVISGQEKTAAEAIDACNEIISGGSVRKTQPKPFVIPFVPARREETWLPYKDAEL